MPFLLHFNLIQAPRDPVSPFFGHMAGAEQTRHPCVARTLALLSRAATCPII